MEVDAQGVLELLLLGGLVAPLRVGHLDAESETFKEKGITPLAAWDKDVLGT